MIEVIPAIDLLNGKCVRLSKGEFGSEKVYSDRPFEVALQFEGAGIRRLHLVDLDGARAGKITNIAVLEEIASRTDLAIDFSGGIRSDADLERVFNAGAKQAMIGSLAVNNPALVRSWLKSYGGEKLILAADVRDEEVAISGWEVKTGILVQDHIHHFMDLDLRTVMCTDAGRDGLLAGPSIPLYKSLRARFPTLRLLASGGVASLDDVAKLDEIGVDGVIIGKALYEGRITLAQIQQFQC